MMLKDMFAGPSKPKQKVPPPSVDQGPIQAAAADAKKRAMLAKGRGSTDIVGSGGLGQVG